MYFFKPNRNLFPSHKFKADLQNSRNLIYDSLGSLNGITFSVTVTNLTKEHRYFNGPFFKSSVPFEGELDTFILPNSPYNNNSFPKRLEYGEVFKQSYSIIPQSNEIYLKMVEKNPDATIQVFVNTTIGELFASNEYRVNQLLENFKYSK